MTQTQADAFAQRSNQDGANGRLFFAAALLWLLVGLIHSRDTAAADDLPDGTQPDRAAQASLLPVGAARVDITPNYPVRLTGYGSRRSESEGVAQKIWAKALAIGDDEGAGPAVLLTIDNCGVTPEITQTVAARLKEKVGLRRERMVVCASHTHAAPALTNWAPLIFGAKIPDEHQQRIDRYTAELTDKLTQVALDALAARRPSRLFWGQGKVGFAANRRVLKEESWTGFGVQADAPVDHSLPILIAKDVQGELIAVIANYACHCTTLGGDFNQICGDWAGYAQQYIEQAHPTAVALITIGCGADANPNPRGTLELCQQHGRNLADEANRLLNTELKPLDGKLECRLTHVELPYEPLPSQEQWQQKAQQSSAAGYHAQVFLERLGKGEELPKSLSYPVGTWTFGDDLAMVFLGGEVVVDYAIRLKSEFDADRLWISAYSNDVPCYIASRRILREGGYEADYSMIYYARPTRFAPEVEDVIVDTVQKLLPPKFYSPAKQADFPPPKSPAESLAAIKLRPGVQVELVAAEPLVVDPVAFDWGPDGRLWVVEMRDYPVGMDGHGMPGGRIRVLDDTDGDGRYDRSRVFLDNIPFPTGVMVWRSGILVTAAPEIFYAEDTDGDGQADVRQTLYQGFGEGNQQHRVNGLRWGLDNWIYVGNGDSGGTVRSLKTGDEVNVRGRDLRIRPDDGLLDMQSGQTQYGRCRDDWGNWFGGNNSNPLWHYVLDDYYLRRNPHFAPPDVRKHVPEKPGAAPVFPASRTLVRFNDFDMTQRFTSACSPIIYRDELLWRGDKLPACRLLGDQNPVTTTPGKNGKRTACGYALVCEPVHNLVHCEIVEPTGVTFTSRRLPDEQQSEFLASTDNWFRPVMIRTGPDGALWIADMYRFVIEHPKWIPAEWQRKLDLRAGDDKGRIYRVYPEGQAPREMPRLDHLDTAGLVAALDSPNGWQRDMTQQMLIWRADKAAIEPLETMCLTGSRPTARLHALCTLDGLQALRTGVISHALADEHPGIRRHAVRLAEPRLDGAPALGEVLISLVHDPDPLVQLQVAYSLGQWHDRRAGRALASMALTHHDDAYLSAAVISSINAENLEEIVAAVLATIDERTGMGSDEQRFIEQLLRVAAALGDRITVNRLLGSQLAPGPLGLSNRQMSAMAGVLAIFGQHERKLESLLNQATRQQLNDIFAAARRTVADNRSLPSDRLSAIQLLGNNLTGQPADTDLLGRLLAPQNSPQLQSAAVEALASRATEQSAQQLLTGWKSHSPALRSQILDVLLSRPSWTELLLAAISRGDVLAGHIDPRRRQQLLQHNNAAIHQRAEQLLAGAIDASRQKVIEQYRDIASLAGDAAAGKTVFNKRCAACHLGDGVGYAVGPDITALTDRSPTAMLVAVLDPNRAVEDRFLDYIAVTADGRQFTGMLSSETGSSITLTGQEGKQVVILRSQLEELHGSGKSLMPEGMEKDISRQELANLLAYLAGPMAKTNPAPSPRP